MTDGQDFLLMRSLLTLCKEKKTTKVDVKLIPPTCDM
jgi:hypothetical protein